VSVMSGRRSVVAAGALALLVTGCSSAEEPEVEQVATTFEDPTADARERCGLLVPAALEQVEQNAGVPCEEAIGDLPLEGGDVARLEVWGGDAQVRLDGDTVFLTKTPTGWRVAAAVCSPRPEGPYDCEVEAS
jgi:hypothetical protein